MELSIELQEEFVCNQLAIAICCAEFGSEEFRSADEYMDQYNNSFEYRNVPALKLFKEPLENGIKLYASTLKNKLNFSTESFRNHEVPPFGAFKHHEHSLKIKGSYMVTDSGDGDEIDNYKNAVANVKKGLLTTKDGRNFLSTYKWANEITSTRHQSELIDPTQVYSALKHKRKAVTKTYSKKSSRAKWEVLDTVEKQIEALLPSTINEEEQRHEFHDVGVDLVRRNKPFSTKDNLADFQVEINGADVDDWVKINGEVDIAMDTNSSSAGGGSSGNNTTYIDLVDEVDNPPVVVAIKQEDEDVINKFQSLIKELKENVMNQRHTYTKRQKIHALNLVSNQIKYDELLVTLSGTRVNAEDYNDIVILPALKKTHDFLITSAMYKKLTMSQLRTWHIVAETDKIKENDIYSRINKGFEAAVWNKLIIVETSEVGGGAGGGGQTRIVANVACNQAQIVSMAKQVQVSELFKNDEKIKKLKFSPAWVCSFIARNDFARRRNSGEGDKPIETTEVINEKLDAARLIIIRLKLTLKVIWNFDETAVTWAISPLYRIVPKNAPHIRVKGSKGESNKNRLSGLLSVSSDGEMAPPMFIIKHTLSKNLDYKKDAHIVLDNIHKKIYTLEKGWSLLIWQKVNLKIPVKKDRDHPEGYKIAPISTCKYLIHDKESKDSKGNTVAPTFTVITSQNKAYNDTVRQVMYNDLILARLQVKYGKDMVLYFDGSKIHSSAGVEESFAGMGIFTNTFSKNLTNVIQPLDTHVNGLVKGNMRDIRVVQRQLAFEHFKKEYEAELDPEKKASMTFSPPPPRWYDIVDAIIFQHQNQFATKEFRESIRKCFCKIGLSPKNAEGKPIDADESTNLASFNQFEVKDHDGSLLSRPLPVYYTPPLDRDVDTKELLSIHAKLVSVQTTDRTICKQVYQYLAKNANIYAKMSFEEFCNKLCRVVTEAEIDSCVSEFRKSNTANDIVLPIQDKFARDIVIVHGDGEDDDSDDEQVLDDDDEIENDDDEMDE